MNQDMLVHLVALIDLADVIVLTLCMENAYQQSQQSVHQHQQPVHQPQQYFIVRVAITM
jgi:hypothetical protein